MRINQAAIQRISELIETGEPISPVGKKGYALTFDEIQKVSGWLTSAINAVESIVALPSNIYRKRSTAILINYQAIPMDHHRASSMKSECVGEMNSLLEALLLDIEAGLISSIENTIRGEIFDDFLDHADEYLKAGRKSESGVIAGVVFEDTIRRIGRMNDVEERTVEDIISVLVKKEIFNQATAKRARVAAHVRTKATHAEWDQFQLEDVSATITFIREIITLRLGA